MTDETKNPQELSNAEVEDLARSVPRPDQYPTGQAEEAAAQLPPDATAAEQATVAALEVTEKISEESPVAQAWDQGVTAVEVAIESLVQVPETPAEAQVHVHGDTTVLFGREYNIPVYTAVFLGLGALTVLEVVLAEIITSNVKIPFLLGIAIAKAVLVVLFYMHLREDNRLFALALILPLAIATLSALFLLAVPPVSYSF
ncbi:MAG: cytochrome C oxidase subunit IV family protein [bacterium]|nr:cytochrome C oxidase subunit IV family protein [bacterium]